MEQIMSDQNPAKVGSRGEVITFFSYKGGTGRTMALANIACLLASKTERHEKILMIDWDLEAPGLDRYFFGDRLRHPKSENINTGTELENRPGLINLFIELNKKTKKLSQEESNDLSNLLESVSFEDYFIPVEKYPRLFILKAGRFDSSYAQHVNSFRWEALYNRCPDLFPALAMRLAREFKYVLIDSRTGLTDISSICTSLMPEKLVLVFTPNRQSLAGIEELVTKAAEFRRQSDDLRPLLAYPLPSRIESTLEDQRILWRKGGVSEDIEGFQPMFEKLFKGIYGLRHCDMESYFNEVQIQQTPELAYGEKIVVVSGQDEDRFSLKRSYDAFLDWLANGYFPWESREESKIKNELARIEAEISKESGNPLLILDFLRRAEKWTKSVEALDADISTKNITSRICRVRQRIFGEDHPETKEHMENLGPANLPASHKVFKRAILSKILSNGLKADFSLIQEEDAYHAALYVDGRHIPGPFLPVPLEPAKGDITHWMGNRPSVGLTAEEAKKIIHEVTLENSVLEHRKLL